MTSDLYQEGDEARLLERAHWLVDGLAHHEDVASRRLAERVRDLLSRPLSPARLAAVVASLEAAIGRVRTLEELTGKGLGAKPEGASAAEEDCPEGFVKDPDTGECIQERRGTRPMTEAASFAKMKLSADLKRLYVNEASAVHSLRGIRDELVLRRKMIEDIVLLAMLSRPVPEPEGRVLLRQLNTFLSKDRRSPLLLALDKLAERGRR